VQAASDKGRSDAPFFDPPSALPVFVIGQPPLSPAFGEFDDAMRRIVEPDALAGARYSRKSRREVQRSRIIICALTTITLNSCQSAFFTPSVTCLVMAR
jgi:hypothetical protein